MYYFVCACGCGKKSKALEKDYMRLPAGKKWVTKGHEKDKEVIREFKGGFIIKQEDF